MPDIETKRIDELPVATSVGNSDLFVVEQGGVAKSVSGSLMTSGLACELVCTLMEDGTLYVDNMTAVANFEKEAF